MKKLLCTVLAGTVLALSCAGCGSSDSNKDTDNSGVTGEITVVSREDGSGTRSAFTELLGILDDRENDATTETAEITNST
ncbi:MAG: phosphate ABC transporter substrate-binding protein, partial [Ruminococcus sp.]|nr:phosphate ABC transporter substrate-binding protein [Ruminococcus sp.]